MPVLREEVYEPEEHDSVPAEAELEKIAKIMNLLAVGVDGSVLEEVFRGAGDHNSVVVVPEREAGQETARADDG